MGRQIGTYTVHLAYAYDVKLALDGVVSQLGSGDAG